MSALAQHNPTNTSSDSVTPISVNARIDYIHRFSKHAILVVDENAQECSSVGYQFLDQLSQQYNAAFVSASTKLNNIQLRCRIIEQLFNDKVFDPEQSLAVSIVNLLNADRQKIAIVIENVQFASLQIIHELTQLALIAKKAELTIKVLILGDYNAGRILATHKDLFQKKLSVLSQQSGQLLALSAKEFKVSQSWLTLTVNKKWLIALASLSLLAIATVLWLKQQEINFANLPESPIAISSLNLEADKTVLSVSSQSDKSNKAVVNKAPIKRELASIQHIYNVLLGNNVAKKEILNEPANARDIVSAITAIESAPKEAVVSDRNLEIVPVEYKKKTVNANQAVKVGKAENIDVFSAKSVPSLTKEANNEFALGRNYYQNFTQGVVIQIAGFTQKSILTEFLADFTDIEFKQYKRALNGEEMTVLTSKHYATRAEAERALYKLPNAILVREPWIKTISAINNEISAFQRSQ
ncbi:MAG: SPOR domain-containing protein [Thalassotalea sp.]